LRTASVWNTNASISIPPPATSQAINAPTTPVSWAKRRGSENTPAPTIDPTTIPVIVMRVSFCTEDVPAAVSVLAMLSLPPPSPRAPGAPTLVDSIQLGRVSRPHLHRVIP
jgi:hypothetical protein